MSSCTFFSLSTQFENLGDLLINRELIELAAKNSQVYVDLSRCTPEFAQNLNLEALSNVEVVKDGSTSLFKKMIRQQRSGTQCYYFLSPGGYFGGLNAKRTVSSWMNTALLGFFHKIGIRICLVGVSYERLTSNYLMVLKLRSRMLFRHYIRDTASADYAEKKGLNYSGLIPDLAFYGYKPQAMANPQNKELKKICFSFRADQQELQLHWIVGFLVVVESLLPHDAEIILYSQVQRDDEVMKNIERRQLFKERKVQRLSASLGTLDDCQKILSECDVIISNRLHVLLLGAMCGANILPCVSGGTNKKVEGIMNDLQVTKSVHMDKFEFSDITLQHLQGVDVSDATRRKCQELIETFKTIYES